uniref:NADH dehydrogenase subunit 6 n=1 Tax=Halistemma rubrum TaxID=316183 RepID=UPI0026E3DFF9|nr:NADH dehydrogenase subunit 6 [Halistemma rubrum]WJJ70214.1 NADH dehydrogenase subunit 6 [Halistemma rubrum]
MYIYNFFFIILMFSAFMTVTSSNPIQSVFWLVLSFLTGSSLLICLQLDFLPLVLIIVYVGAIVILFLFVIMMLEITQHNRSPVYNVLPILIIFSITGIGNMLILLKIKNFNKHEIFNNWSFNNINDLYSIGVILYTNYFIPLVILTILLLVGLVGAILLGLETSERRKQEMGIQQRRNNSWI